MGILLIILRDCMAHVPRQCSPLEHPSREERTTHPHYVRRILWGAPTLTVALQAHTPPREEDQRCFST